MQTLKIAVGLHQSGRLEEARAQYEHVLEQDPQEHRALHLLGVLFYQLDDGASAEAFIGRAIAIQPMASEYHDNLGNVLRNRGRLEDAIASYRRGLALDSKDAKALSNLGKALRDQGDIDGAIESLRAALEIRPTLADAHRNLGLALRDRGDWDGAIASFKKAVSLKPDYEKALIDLKDAEQEQQRTWQVAEALNRGNRLMEGEWEGAIAAFDEAIRLQPDSTEALAGRRRARKKQEQAQAAEKIYQDGLMLRDAGRLDEAISAFENALQDCAALPHVEEILQTCLRHRAQQKAAADRVREAIVYETQEDLQGALTAFAAAISLQPELADAIEGRDRVSGKVANRARAAILYQEGTAFREQGRLEEAVTVLDEARALFAALPKLSEALSECREEQARIRAAQERAATLRLQAAHAQQEGRFDDAIAACEQVLTLQPADAQTQQQLEHCVDLRRRRNDAAACYDKGVAFEQSGALSEAIEAFEEAIALDPVDTAAGTALTAARLLHTQWFAAAAAYAQGRTALDQENAGEAIACFDRALALRPTLAGVSADRARAIQLRQRHEAALDLFMNAQACFDARQWAAAMDAAAQSLQLRPLHADVTRLLENARVQQTRLENAAAVFTEGCGAAERGAFESAIAAFEKTLDLQADHPEAAARLTEALAQKAAKESAMGHYTQGLELLKGGQYDSAINAFDEAIALYPALSGATTARDNARNEKAATVAASDSYQRGVELSAQLRFDDAIMALENAVRLRADFDAAKTALEESQRAKKAYGEAILARSSARDLLATGAIDFALADLSRARQLFDLLPGIGDEIAQALALKRQWERAQDAYQEGLREVQSRRFVEAIAAFDEALTLKLEFPEAVAARTNAEQARQNVLAAEACVRQGGALRVENRYAEAITAFEQALAFDPHMHMAEEELARARRDRDFFAAAQACLAQTGPLYEQGRLAEAIASLQQALIHWPELRQAQQELDHALARKRQWDEAQTDFDEAVTQRAQGNLDRAIALLKSAVNLHAEQSEFKAALVETTELQARWNEAVAMSRNGDALRARSEWDAAIGAYQRSLALRPEAEAVQAALDQVLVLKQRWSDARSAAIEGSLLRQQNLLDAAIGAFERSLELRADDASVRSELKEVQALKSNWQKAVDLYHLGLENAERGNDDAAIRTFRKALVLRPEQGDVSAALKRVIDHKERTEKARKATTRAQRLRDRGETEAAIAAFHEALGFIPDFAEARRALDSALDEKGRQEEAFAARQQANVLATQGQLTEAVAQLRRALELKPDFTEAQTALEELLSRKAAEEKAAASYEHALSQRDQGDLAGAVDTLRQALILQPQHGPAAASLTQIQGVLNQHQAAEQLHRQAAEQVASGQLAEAVLTLRRVLELHPEFSAATDLLRQVQAQQTRWEQADALAHQAADAEVASRLDEAISLYQRSLDLHPEMPPVQSALQAAQTLKTQWELAEAAHREASCWSEKGAWDQAIAAFETALRLRPGIPGAGNGLAVAKKLQERIRQAQQMQESAISLYQSGQMDAAIDQLTQALGLDANLRDARAKLDQWHVERSRWRESQAAFELGRDYMTKSQPALAVTAFRSALTLRPDFVEAQEQQFAAQALLQRWEQADQCFQRGAAHLARQQYAEAIEPLSQALELKPDFTEARFAIVQARSDFQRTNDAKRAFQAGAEAQQAGKSKEAQALFISALELDPRHSAAAISLDALRQEVTHSAAALQSYFNGLELRDDGQLKAAIEAFENATAGEAAGNPELLQAHLALGQTLEDNQQLEDAIACYRRSIVHHPQAGELHARLGRALAKAQQTEAAIPALRQAVELAPEILENWSQLAAQLDAKGRHSDVASVWQKAIEHHPRNGDLHFNLGLALTRRGAHQDAVIEYRRALALEDANADAYCNLGAALAHTGQAEQAVEAYRRAIEIAPTSANAYNNMGLALAQLGRLQPAVDAFQQATALRPFDAEAQWRLGVALGHLRRLKDAIQAFERAIEMKPDYGQAHLSLGLAYLHSGKWGEAAAALRQSLALKPGIADALCHLGIALTQQGLFDDAIAAFRKALAANPKDIATSVHLGKALMRKGEYGKAIAAWRKVLALQSDHLDALRQLAESLAHLSQWDEAVTTCQRALTLRPSDPEIHCQMGSILARRGQRDAALQAIGRVLELQPDHAASLRQSGVILAQLGKQDDAISALRRVLAIMPEDAETYADLGNMLLLKGQAEEALVNLRRAAELRPDLPAMHTHLANTLIRVGQYQAAIAAAQMALTYAPEAAGVYNTLGVAYRYEGALSEATEAFRQALVLQPNFPEARRNLDSLYLAAGMSS